MKMFMLGVLVCGLCCSIGLNLVLIKKDPIEIAYTEQQREMMTALMEDVK